MSDAVYFGPPQQAVTDINQISGAVIEQLALALEARGLRTPLSNLVGFPTLSPRSFTISNNGAAETTTSTAWVNLTTDVLISNLRAGQYQFWWGGYAHISTVAQEGWLGVQVNGTDPGVPTLGTYDFKTVQFNTVDNVWNWNWAIATLTGDTNTVRLRKAVTNAAATFSIWNASIFALRLGQN